METKYGDLIHLKTRKGHVYKEYVGRVILVAGIFDCHGEIDRSKMTGCCIRTLDGEDVGISSRDKIEMIKKAGQ